MDEPTDITNSTSIMTDIFIFLDTSWEYNRVVDYVNYVVERLNINAYGSSITLLAARDGSVMVNRTFYITEFYKNWNVTTHSWYQTGFSLPIILSKARYIADKMLSSERDTGSLGGRSLIALLIPSPTAFVHEYDFDYCQNYVKALNFTMPDLKIVFYAGGAVIRFMDYVSNPSEDLFPLDYDRSVTTCGVPLVKRLRRVPRRLTNPRCSSNGISFSRGSNELKEYEGLGKIIFYRLSPNYFYNEGSMRYLKVKPQSSVVFTVCTSRTIALPYRNYSNPVNNGFIHCKQMSSNDFNYDLTDMCSNFDQLLDCSPLYISVQAQGFADVSQVFCTNAECSTPTSAQFSIFVNNLECINSGHKATVDLIIIILILLLLTNCSVL